jgi:cation diffusion facilitator CzcD-associated flavoprotein CzcO
MTRIEAKTMGPNNVVEVAIIGAGPYGLSVAAHLSALDIPFRIFGDAMTAWSGQMPKGMRLKSEGFASNISDPKSEFTLGLFCKQQGLPYEDVGLPVPLETFVAYGLAFQKKFVRNLENKKVVCISPNEAGFELTLDNNEKLSARRVVMAIGITQFAHVPAELSAFSPDLVTHSREHSDLQQFRGRQVAVVGAGASALDIAALLNQAGASVQLISRSGKIRFHNPPAKRSLFERMRNPTTGIGFGADFLFYVTTPHLFRLLPEWLRLDRMRKTLGPAPGWFVRDECVGKFPMHLNTNVVRASADNGRISLQLSDGQKSQTATFDHVIAATGYKVDVESLAMLDSGLRKQIRYTGQSPFLSAHFESSVPGLYFVGVASANTFGPVMRFAFGARYTANRITKHLARVTQTAAQPSKERVSIPTTENV